MLTIRLITAGAVLVAAVGAAAAQGNDTAGKPVSLLQVLSQPTTATTTTTTTVTTTTADKPHARFVHKRVVRHWAKKSHEQAADESATDQSAQGAANTAAPGAGTPTAAAPTPTPSAWAADAAPLPGVATDATAPTVIPTVDQNLSAVVVGGHAAQLSTPDEFNAIDLVGDHQRQAETLTAPAVNASPVALAAPDDHARDAWYEELLATLGGALAAGVVAWFLVMGGSQQRMYG